MQSLFQIKLNTIEDVKTFVDVANKFNGRVTVRNMHYAVDGKSIMGIFSIDLSGVLIVEFDSEPSKEIINLLSHWRVE